MKYGISELSIIPVRKKPAEKSEMLTQILFGEHFELLEETENWTKVKLAYDQYEGWVDAKMISRIESDLFASLNEQLPAVANDTFNLVLQEKNYANQLIVPGSSFPFCNTQEKSFRIGEKKYFYQGKVAESNSLENLRDSIVESALQYFNAPYLWGGRTPYGIDCSGFTQIVYKLNSIKIPRDASQQAQQGDSLTFLEESLPGDLAFFDDKDGRITHVGIIWDRQKIIHASGKVRIDNVDHEGIFNVDTKRYTHTLRLIKRIVKA